MRLLGVLGALLISCGGGTAESPPTTNVPAAPRTAVGQNERAPVVDAAPGAGPVVRLLDPGAEPRAPLRYRFEAGHRESMVMDMTMRMGSSIGDQITPTVDLPMMRMTMEIRVVETRADGTMRHEFRLTSGEVPERAAADPAVVAVMESQLASLVGLTGWGLVTDRGLTLAGDVVAPPGASPEAQQVVESMRSTFKQVSAPLPEEPVGAGARWVCEMSVETPMAHFRQAGTYTLIESAGSRGRMDVVVRGEARPQRLVLPGVPPTTTVMLESALTQGTGTVQFDLGRVVPISDSSIGTHVAATAEEGANTTRITNDVESRIVVRPGP